MYFKYLIDPWAIFPLVIFIYLFKSSKSLADIDKTVELSVSIIASGIVKLNLLIFSLITSIDSDVKLIVLDNSLFSYKL